MTPDFMIPPPGTLSTRWGPMWLSKEGILINIGAEASQSREEVAEYVSNIRMVCDGIPRPFLIEISRMRTAGKDVRDEYNRQNIEQTVTAMALVTSSSISKMLGNIIIGINKSKLPVKLFTDPVKARAWLLQYINTPHEETR